MDRDLTVTSELGVGSTFSFTATFRVAPIVDDFAGLRALVIDDSATKCLVCCKHLTW